MKTPIFLTIGLALLAATALPCQAQTPASPAAAPPPETSSAVAPAPAAAPARPPGFTLPEGPPLETRVFEIPQDFLSKGSTSTEPSAPVPPPSWKTVFEHLGIEFTAPGAKVIKGPGRWEVTMTNTSEQLHNTDTVLNQRFGVGIPHQGQVRVEVFSLPPLAAWKALIAHPKEAELHTWLDSELTKPGSGVKLERHSLTIVRASQKSLTQSIADIPYASHFLPGLMPQTLSLPAPAAVPTAPSTGSQSTANTSSASASASAAAPTTPTPDIRPLPTPNAFIRRQTGDKFDVELSFLDDPPTVVDLNLAAETSRRLGIIKLGLHGNIHQPAWQTQKTTAQAAGFIGKPMLISTFSPPVNTGVPGGNTLDRTWLLFVTVTEPE